MKKTIFLLFLSTLLLKAEDFLDELLSEYREAQELYIETQAQEGGHVIVFSRADLDKMQAYTLNDVLKTLRMFTLKTTKFGLPTLIKSPYSEQTTSGVKLFIDSYEVTSLTAGTGLSQFGRMGLNHIDHIEIYQASNAIAFTGEPGNMVIKLYTKDPSRENATVAQISLDSRGGSRAQLIEANSFGEYLYLANADINRYNQKEYTLDDGSELSRDGYRGQFYFNLSKKNDFKLEAGVASERDELFDGFGNSIDDGELFTKNYYVQFTKEFDDNIRLILNSSYEEVEVTNRDSQGFYLQGDLPADPKTTNLVVKNGLIVHNAILQKRTLYEDHSILLGAELKLKNMFLDELKSNEADRAVEVGPKDLNVYMLYAEDTYAINNNNKITLGAKLDFYDNHFSNTSTEHVLRFGYLSSLDNDTSLKIFIQKGYIYPLFAQTTFAPIYKPNPNLESVKNLVAKVEIEKKIDNLTLTLGVGGSKSKNGIVFDRTLGMYVNTTQKSDFEQFFINSNYKFDADNKLILEYFRAYNENASYSSDNGALMQLYNRIGKFDIYNELIYRSSYVGIDGIKIDTGYDYTLGAIYHYNKKLTLKAKGENLFDRASQIGINGLKIAPYDRRAIFTMEYVF